MKLIFIGTLHKGFTPIKELEKLILKYHPELLLVEIEDKDISSGNIKGYPEEMIAALKFAKSINIPVRGFDYNIDVTKKGITLKDIDSIVEEQRKIISKFNWKDFNKEKYCTMLGGDSIIDKEKWDNREKEMEKNLRKLLPDSGKILILTGCAHLAYFEKKFPEAEFPLRAA